MSKRTRYFIYAFMIAFGWLSQILYPGELIWETIGWTLFILLIAMVIEIWAKP